MGWYRPNCLVPVPEAKRGQFVATSPSQSCAIRARLRMAGELRMRGRGTRSITGNFQSAKLISSVKFAPSSGRSHRREGHSVEDIIYAMVPDIAINTFDRSPGGTAAVHSCGVVELWSSATPAPLPRYARVGTVGRVRTVKSGLAQ